MDVLRGKSLLQHLRQFTTQIYKSVLPVRPQHKFVTNFRVAQSLFHARLDGFRSLGKALPRDLHPRIQKLVTD